MNDLKSNIVSIVLFILGWWVALLIVVSGVMAAHSYQVPSSTMCPIKRFVVIELIFPARLLACPAIWEADE